MGMSGLSVSPIATPIVYCIKISFVLYYQLHFMVKLNTTLLNP